MSDAWSHPNKEWHKTLALARSFGWDPPQKMGNHGGLLLRCPASDPRHQIRIFSTGGKNTESVAISMLRKIRNCPHRDLSLPLARVETALSGAAQILAAAESLLELAEADTRMETLLQDLDTAGEQLDEVQKEFDAASAVADAAQERIEPQLRARDPADLITEAGGSLREVELGLRDDIPSEHTAWDDLAQRHRMLKSRLERLQERGAK